MPNHCVNVTLSLRMGPLSILVKTGCNPTIKADKVAVNTAVIKNINFLKEATEIFGSSTLSISIEAVKLEITNITASLKVEEIIQV